MAEFDRPLMLWVNLSVVDTTHPKRNKFAQGVKIKGTGNSNLTGFGLIMLLTLFIGERYFTVLHRSDERWVH